MRSFVLGIVFVLNFALRAEASAPVQITSFADIIEPLMPSVVNVYTVKNSQHIDPTAASLPEMLPFEQFNNFLEQGRFLDLRQLIWLEFLYCLKVLHKFRQHLL